MALFILIIFVLTIYFIDKRKYKTVFTPSIILAVPFTVIAVLYKLFASHLGFYELNDDVLFIWIFGLIFFWIPGLISSYSLKNKNYTISKNDLQNQLFLFTKQTLNFTFCLGIVLTYYFYNAYLMYISSGGDAVETYLGRGLQAHLIILFKYLSVFSFLSLFSKGSVVNKLKNIYILIIAIGLSILYATKSGILILLLSYYFSYSLFFNAKLKFYHLVFALATAFGVFLLSYSLVFGYMAPLDFIFNHTLLYFVSGTASMNAYFQNIYITSLDPEILIKPLLNFFYSITGQTDLITTAVSDIWTPIGNGTSINVKTFFGTIYLYGGLGYGILTVIIFSLILHKVFLDSLKTRDFFSLALYVQLISVLSFGWFDFYFNSVSFYDTIFFTLLFKFLFLKNTNEII